MGCISPSQSVSAIPKYDDETQNAIAQNIRMHQVSVLIELSENDIDNIDASIPATPKSYKLRSPNKSTNSKKSLYKIPRKLSTSISSVLNPFRSSSKHKQSSSVSATSISFEKQPKFRARNNCANYQSSSESEIKEKDASTTKPSKSKASGSKYKGKKFASYKGSTSDTSTMDIKDEDSSSSHDFASITKLTNMLSEHDNLNSSGNETVVENDMKDAAVNITDAVSQLSSAISTNFKNKAATTCTGTTSHAYIKNPFYHSDEDPEGDECTFASDGTAAGTGDDSQSCLSDVTSDDTSCYQSYGGRTSRTSSKQIRAIKPNAVGDKIKMVKFRERNLYVQAHAFRGSIRLAKNNPFRYGPKSKASSRRSRTSYNSIKAHITSSIMDRDDSVGTGRCTHDSDGEPPPLPLEWFQSNSMPYHEYMDVAQMQESDYYFDESAAEDQKCHQRPLQGSRPCPPPHVFNHYRSYINTAHEEVCEDMDEEEEEECLSDASTHI